MSKRRWSFVLAALLASGAACVHAQHGPSPRTTTLGEERAQMMQHLSPLSRDRQVGYLRPPLHALGLGARHDDAAFGAASRMNAENLRALGELRQLVRSGVDLEHARGRIPPPAHVGDPMRGLDRGTLGTGLPMPFTQGTPSLHLYP